MNDTYLDIIERGEKALSEFVSQEFQESVSLEFKEKANRSHGHFEKDDRRNLGKTISALSNSFGGLLIWGVRATRNSDGVDCAHKLLPIKEIEKFRAETSTLIGQIVTPMNDGISVEMLESEIEPESGYLVIWVERSERRPHRSEAAGDKSYYKRVGDSSYPMEHYDIEDAFRRTTTPSIKLGWVVRKRGSGSSGGVKYSNCQIVLQLINESNVSALFPYLTITKVDGARVDEFGIDGNYGVGLPKRPSIGGFLFGGGSDHAIHPGQHIDVTSLKLVVVEDGTLQKVRNSSTLLSQAVEKGNIHVELEYQIGCKDSQTLVGLLEIDRETIEQCLS